MLVKHSSDGEFVTWRCTACGSSRRSRAKFWPDKIHHACRGPCKHQSTAAIDTALIECESCEGNVRIKFPIHECAIFGKSIPTYSGVVDDGHGCIGCERREVI